MLFIARNKEFPFVYLPKSILKTTSNAIFYIKKVNFSYGGELGPVRFPGIAGNAGNQRNGRKFCKRYQILSQI